MAAIVGARAQPVARQALVKPDAPADVEGLPGVAVRQGPRHVHTGEHGKYAQEPPERGLVQRLQRTVEAVVPE
ncbi:hypothetical protein D9M68_568500 [compost metagenome]